jgi:hypothetical protein
MKRCSDSLNNQQSETRLAVVFGNLNTGQQISRVQTVIAKNVKPTSRPRDRKTTWDELVANQTKSSTMQNLVQALELCDIDQSRISSMIAELYNEGNQACHSLHVIPGDVISKPSVILDSAWSRERRCAMQALLVASGYDVDMSIGFKNDEADESLPDL